MTLIEVLVSILLLSIIASTFLHVFLFAFNNSVAAQEITNYTYAAQAAVEEMRADDYGTLIKKMDAQTGLEAFDINGDGTSDCFMGFRIVPYGIMDKSSGGTPGAFVHIIYLVDKVLVVDGEGGIIHTSAKINPTITLNLQDNSDVCTMVVNGVSTTFSRGDKDRYVCVMANLNYKDLGYNNNLVVTGDKAHVLVKSYGNDVIIEEFTANVTLNRFSGIQNLNSSLVKIDVELFHESTDTIPFFDISEIVEVEIGDRDTLVP